jgi:hypothetical protein
MVFWIIGKISDCEVPILDEMSLEIDSDSSSNLNSDIVPWHSRLILSIKVALEIFSRLCDSSLSFIIIIGALPKIVFIINGMIMCIPTTIANINTTHKCNLLINDNRFFMMRPQLRNDQTGMSQNLEVLMQILKQIPNIERVIVDKQTWLLEN